MLRMRTSLFVLLLSLLMNGAGAAGCGTKRDEAKTNDGGSENTNAAVVQPTPGRVEEALSVEIKVLAEGYYGKVNDAFVAVVRDAATYAALRGFVGNLPQVEGDFFNKNLVVAAFLGQRRTGGYSVQIKGAGDNRLRVSSTAPPKGAMTTQALTAPFKIVSVSASDERPLLIEVDPNWNDALRPYRITGGEFATGGGFAGRIEKLQLAGDVRVGRLGTLVSFVFDLKSTGGTKARTLQNVATGIVGAGGAISGAIVDAGALVDLPRSPLAIKGSFAANEDKLSLTFESLPSNVADGYSGQGKLDAAATAPAPPKNESNDDDAPM